MKRRNFLILFSALFLYSISFIPAFAEEGIRVEMFSPEGVVKGVRQAAVHFSGQMVSFGDPRLSDPFEVSCPEKGKGRWADGRNWSYDFDRDLPAGVVCTFKLKDGVRDLSGNPVTGRREFSFSTGGPAIQDSSPHDGQEDISEDQIFALLLDTEADEASVLSNVGCSVEGINERIGIRIIKGSERNTLLKVIDRWQEDQYKDMPRLVIQCRQNFPAGSRVSLVWVKGVHSLSGVSTTEDQVLHFMTRPPFTATFRCNRENARADCIPILPLSLDFSAPVEWELARKIVMKVGGKIYKPSREKGGRQYEEESDVAEESVPEGNDAFVYGVAFKGPFPEHTSYTIELPGELKDDAGRRLSNMDKFPLTVRTDSYPPLAKFSARFGIIELKGDATLPVTLRNLEPGVQSRMLRVSDRKADVPDKAKEGLLDEDVKLGDAVGSPLPAAVKAKSDEYVGGLKGRLHKIRMDKEEKIIEWMKTVASARREQAILKDAGDSKDFRVPKPGGSRAFEVVGIPLKEAGFYVIEMKSRILGEVLLGAAEPLYVPTSTLVTNLSAHFKWGRESSLVWVTSLDKAEPVGGATVSIRDCNGKSVWTGRTDDNGIARIKKLPDTNKVARCSANINYSEAEHALQGINEGLFVFARTADDMTLVHSSWDNGIEPWRYNLPMPGYHGPVIAHTVLDRSLLRAGETVHMKHILRKHTMAGFALIGKDNLPKSVLISHRGSDQRYEFPLKWDGQGVAETTWNIPTEAKLGSYEVFLLNKAGKAKAREAVGGYEEGDEGYLNPEGQPSGSFRVEEFRVPLMKAVIQPPKDSLIKAKETDVDLLVTYLAGGGAGNLPVKVRSQIQPRFVHFPDYEDYVFANGEVKEEKTTRASYDETAPSASLKMQTAELKLDAAGSARTRISDLPQGSEPKDILTELEFRDPNGEVQTVSRKIPLWPSKALVGIKPDSWAMSKESFKFLVAVIDLSGKPLSDKDVKVELLEKKYYSHRKRLVGGFYSYEHVSEIKKIGRICEGRTDVRGLLPCEAKSPVSGNVVLQAQTSDDAGNISYVNRDVWIAGKDQWWFDVTDNDRMDILPEKKKYEPGETARFQVRMPFRKATALITVEREGVAETFVRKLSGASPVVEIPIKKNYAPNVFVSVLVTRGRVSGVQPTALVDLGKPAYKLGIAEINVGWRGHELKVNVSSDRDVYKVREKARVTVKVQRPDGTPPPKGSEVALVAVDEGLLELMPNQSWKLLDAMMGRRGYEVHTSTAQMQVVGKRHYGLKAMPQGGGGGRQVTREMFDTLLLWKGRVSLDKNGEAAIEIPLNDSITGFRIVAVASGGVGLFGTGQTSIRTNQDLMALSGIPHLVREGDKFRAVFTVRNASKRPMTVDIEAKLKDREERTLDPISASLSPGEAKEVGWDITVPSGIDSMSYEFAVRERGGEASDSLKVKQKVAEAIPVKIYQATLTQVEGSYSIEVEKPTDSVAGKGGVTLSLRPRLFNGLGGVTWYMKKYPYGCMEQKVSKAVALRDEALWKGVVAELPAHLDSDGLVKYFPLCREGSDTLTSYILSIAHEAGWSIPDSVREKMLTGLKGFIEGKVIRYSSLPTADLSIRKMAGIEALSRYGQAEPKLLDSISIEPNLWSTSAVIDWMNVLVRMINIPSGEKRMKEAEQVLRSRMNFQGTTMGFSTEGTDNLWWLMLSADQNAVRTVLTFLDVESWRQDMPRLVRGALGRQYKGRWDLTTANAWGVLAMEKFSKKFEAVPVTGVTSATMDEKEKSVAWDKSEKGESLVFGWPKGKETLHIKHEGEGKPWATIQSLAAIPLKEPISSGYRITKTLKPVDQKEAGKWSKGDVVRIRLDLESQTDMTWVVVNDPVPAGSAILGTGLGRDSKILTGTEKWKEWVWPVFEERSFEAYRAYYEFVPKGKWSVEYTVRLNNEGVFNLPPTRVEALYSPEMIGETPNKRWEVGP